MNPEQERIVREELWRSVAWAALGIVGWPTLVTELNSVEQNLFTVFGLPVVTWVVLTTGMIGLRFLTGAELQYRTPSLPGFLIGAVILGGLGAVYLVAIEEYNPLLVIAGEAAIGAATLFWYWYVGVFDSRPGSTS
jgi:hypothetical protein